MNCCELSEMVYGVSVYAGWLTTDVEDDVADALDDAIAAMDITAAARIIAGAAGGRVTESEVRARLEREAMA